MTSIIVGMAVTVFAIRYLFIGMAGRYQMPEPIEKALSFSPPVVLAGIVVTTISTMLEVNDDSQSMLVILTSLFTALGLALYTKNLLLAISSGMVLYGTLSLITN